MKQDEKKTIVEEKGKLGRETMGKFFYDLAKASFTTMVLGAILSFFVDETKTNYGISLLVIGIFVTSGLASIGRFILKKL